MSQSSPLQGPHLRGTVRPSSCSVRSFGSTGTVQHRRLRSLSGRSLSGSSLSSLNSLWRPPFRRQDDGPAARSLSSSNLTFRHTTSTDGRSICGTSRRASVASALSSRWRSDSAARPEATERRLLGVTESEAESMSRSGDELSLTELEPEPTEEPHTSEERPGLPMVYEEHLVEDALAEYEASPGVRRWLSTLKKRKRRKQSPSRIHSPRAKTSPGTVSSPVKRRTSRHKPSDSQGSSLAFVTAVRSATATIASFSIRSKGNSYWGRGHQHSSFVSSSDPRPSIDSQRSVFDEAARQRSRKRRAKLEELVHSEEGYLADVRALSKAYTLVGGHQPTVAHFARSRAQKNISDIVALHEALLRMLHTVIPFADYDQRMARSSPTTTLSRAHGRFHSVDIVPARSPPTHRNVATIRHGRRSLNISRSSAEEDVTLTCSPQIVAVVAKHFTQYVRQIERFVVYEEYGANFELVQRDVEDIQHAIAAWPDFDRAIEVLSAHVNPVRSREANHRKALTFKDLLIKPIQRLPRYEMLFNDLCKLTPVCDDPDSNVVLRDLLIVLNEACMRMNAAKDNPNRARMMEVTSLLGDRLSFSNQVPRSVFLQLLGQVQLCGCLYIAYRSRERIKGLYTICVLFESILLLATAEEDSARYSTIAGIPLANATIVECDNGKGLQCHTALYSWKLVFEHGARMFEVLMVACSEVEAQVWRRHTSDCITTQSRAVADGMANVFELHSPLTSEMRSVGKAFGKPGSFVRRMSVQRTATVGPTTDLNQVIIKNTQSAKEAVDNSSNTSLQIPRSQSVATPSHVQTLAPRRADRIRLEALLSDVWTKDLIPYPGMIPRRSDPIRASANHVIRKFSMASITSNFSSSKRSASYTSIAQPRKEDMPPRPKAMSSGSRAGTARPTRPLLVDFHNAPEAFLPADFELQDPAAKRKKSALRTFTMTMERPFSPLLGTDNKFATLRRAQSVKDIPQTEPPPAASAKVADDKSIQPVYSVVQERSKTPVPNLQLQRPSADFRKEQEAPAKTPKKSKSRLLRFFG